MILWRQLDCEEIFGAGSPVARSVYAYEYDL
jgi:hypothetical protein